MKDYTIYVTEDIAKKAMEKGFECDIVTTAAFGEEPHCYNEFQIDKTLYRCPTAEQICGWLRETYGIVIPVTYYYNLSDTPHYEINIFEWAVDYPNKETSKCCGEGFADTYKDALLEGINKALDLI